MGTPFNTGQLGKLQSVVSIAVSTALPRVAAKFDDPKTVLKALEGKGELFAGHLESALAEAIGRMLVLIPRPPVTVTLGERHDPDRYYRTREGLYVYGDFRERVASRRPLVACRQSRPLSSQLTCHLYPLSRSTASGAGRTLGPFDTLSLESGGFLL